MFYSLGLRKRPVKEASTLPKLPDWIKQENDPIKVKALKNDSICMLPELLLWQKEKSLADNHDQECESEFEKLQSLGLPALQIQEQKDELSKRTKITDEERRRYSFEKLSGKYYTSSKSYLFRRIITDVAISWYIAHAILLFMGWYITDQMNVVFDQNVANIFYSTSIGQLSIVLSWANILGFIFMVLVFSYGIYKGFERYYKAKDHCIRIKSAEVEYNKGVYLQSSIAHIESQIWDRINKIKEYTQKLFNLGLISEQQKKELRMEKYIHHNSRVQNSHFFNDVRRPGKSRASNYPKNRHNMISLVTIFVYWGILLLPALLVTPTEFAFLIFPGLFVFASLLAGSLLGFLKYKKLKRYDSYFKGFQRAFTVNLFATVITYIMASVFSVHRAFFVMFVIHTLGAALLLGYLRRKVKGGLDLQMKSESDYYLSKRKRYAVPDYKYYKSIILWLVIGCIALQSGVLIIRLFVLDMGDAVWIPTEIFGRGPIYPAPAIPDFTVLISLFIIMTFLWFAVTMFKFQKNIEEKKFLELVDNVPERRYAAEKEYEMSLKNYDALAHRCHYLQELTEGLYQPDDPTGSYQSLSLGHDSVLAMSSSGLEYYLEKDKDSGFCKIKLDMKSTKLDDEGHLVRDALGHPQLLIHHSGSNLPISGFFYIPSIKHYREIKYKYEFFNEPRTILFPCGKYTLHNRVGELQIHYHRSTPKNDHAEITRLYRVASSRRLSQAITPTPRRRATKTSRLFPLGSDVSLSSRATSGSPHLYHSRSASGISQLDLSASPPPALSPLVIPEESSVGSAPAC